MQIEFKKVDEIVPYARNPKAHPDAQVNKIVASINAFGFLIPVLLFYLRFFVFTCIFQYFYTLHSPAESYPL